MMKIPSLRSLVLSLAFSIAGTGLSAAKTETATFGAGCFWCSEAVMQRVEGVIKTDCGYMGGSTKNPTYKQVCTGTTGHAEVTRVVFDPSVISYSELLDIFWQLHDPTTLNRQGADAGTQYRSVIFYYGDEQKRIAEESRKKAGIFYPDPIVTEITPASKFYKAEGYHQDYYNQNKSQGYCRVVIHPKLKKLKMEE